MNRIVMDITGAAILLALTVGCGNKENTSVSVQPPMVSPPPVTQVSGTGVKEKVAPQAERRQAVFDPVVELGSPLQSQNNMKKIAIAFHKYHQAHQRFPGGANNQQQVKLSWPVQLLPFLEQSRLHERIKAEFASTKWNDAQAQALLSEMPSIFWSSASDNAGLTRYRVFSGRGTLFSNERGTSMREIRDGTSMTILAIEVGPEKAAPWIQPGGIPINSENLLTELGSPREAGYAAVMVDGSVITLRKDITEKTLRAMISPAGLEVVNRADYLPQ